MGIFSRLLERDAENLSINKIKGFEREIIASKESSKLSIEYSELMGYHYLRFYLISPIDINTFKGCRIGFKNQEQEIIVDSDSSEIITFFSNKLNLGLSEFEVEIEDSICTMIKEKKIDQIVVFYKNDILELEVIEKEYLRSIMFD
ncbi:hypothetical protein KFE94_15135 [bacterium SCSIO 12643]|nr:hypothetical protein KFE94_15135 [bacterium SCSIO 12643]